MRSTLFSSCGNAPASRSILTTSACPPSAARCRGVDSLVLFRDAVTMDRSNFINCWSTSTDPCIAAIWAQVLPSYLRSTISQKSISKYFSRIFTLFAANTKAGWCFKNNRTTSEWFCWAAK